MVFFIQKGVIVWKSLGSTDLIPIYTAEIKRVDDERRMSGTDRHQNEKSNNLQKEQKRVANIGWFAHFRLLGFPSLLPQPISTGPQNSPAQASTKKQPPNRDRVDHAIRWWRWWWWWWCWAPPQSDIWRKHEFEAKLTFWALVLVFAHNRFYLLPGTVGATPIRFGTSKWPRWKWA